MQSLHVPNQSCALILPPSTSHPPPPQAMVASSPPLPRSQVVARDTGSFAGLGVRSAWSTLKAHVRSLATNNNSTGTTADDLPAQTKPPARAVSTPHLIAIVSGAVGAAIALAAVLALMHVLRVRRKVERFRRSTNVLGPGASSSQLIRRVSQTGVCWQSLVRRCRLY